MPKRTDIKKILIIGSGPIVIGQACEFDYSGTQACKALREEGYEIVLVNSNPATIMTDPELADRTYIEPLTTEFVAKVIRRERPDALLPTVGGQTALNIAVDLADSGILDEYKVEMIGAKAPAVKMAEDRQLFKQAMAEIGLDTPRSEAVGDVREAQRVVQNLGFPIVIRPSFTLGGVGGGIAFNSEEFESIVQRGLDLSPVHTVLIEESVIGWKEFELEVMRDLKDNVVIICSIENFDPAGCTATPSRLPAKLTDHEYSAARRGRRDSKIGVETGGSNVHRPVKSQRAASWLCQISARVRVRARLEGGGFSIAIALACHAMLRRSTTLSEKTRRWTIPCSSQ
jgi:carbamoyl-phosphate synthase large subunit